MREISEKTCDFSATIRKIGINPYVEAPEHVSQFFGSRGYVRVAGALNGVAIRATLVPTGNGRHRLYVNGDMRKKANVKVGDVVNLSLKLDTKPRELIVPKVLVDALERNEKARTEWKKLQPSHRKEILDYLNYLKKPESLKRNVEKVVSKLAEPEKKKA